MSQVPDDFVSGLEGVVAFTTEIAEPDKDGGALRYRGVDIEDLVTRHVAFGDVWALLVDGRFGHGLPPAMAVGKAVAAAIVDGETPPILDRFDPGRFATPGRPVRAAGEAS